MLSFGIVYYFFVKEKHKFGEKTGKYFSQRVVKSPADVVQ